MERERRPGGTPRGRRPSRRAGPPREAGTGGGSRRDRSGLAAGPRIAASVRPGAAALLLGLWLAGPGCGGAGPEADEPETGPALGADRRSDLAPTGGRFDADALPGRPGRAAAPHRPPAPTDPVTGLPLVSVAPCPAAPALGPANAPLQVVVFTDFQCPFCRRHAGDLRRLVERYGDRLRLVFRNFPLPYHELAEPAAEAAMEAQAEGRFWEFHDRLMDPEAGELTVERIRRTAAEAGLDPARVETAIRNRVFAAAIERDLADGRAAGVDGTPRTFINRREVDGLVGFDRLVEICDALLDAASAAERQRAAPGDDAGR